MKRLYYSFNDYLREKFHQKVYKISLDSGFNCPNRDGTLAVGGCTYCDEGSRAPGVNPTLSIQEQLLEGMARMKKRYHAQKFIAYFQAYTNTYDKVEVLQERYEKALSHPDIVGLSVSTRPDTLSQGALDLLDDIGKKYLVWLELGLQTIHDRTNELLNRWHTFEQFKTTLLKAKEKPNLKICTHLILGLPGETIQVRILLKFLASYGLIGLPNAGKSSLLNELTNAKAKIGNYPFTTPETNLGEMDGKIIADIPGLIEGTAEGKGLGIKFLKHIEKVTLLLHCISSESDHVSEDYEVITNELGKFSPKLLEKNRIILLTKTDIVPEEKVLKQAKELKKFKYEILPISLYDAESIEKLRKKLG